MRRYVPPHIRAARRMTSFILFAIGVALTVGLYYVKTRAQSARIEATHLQSLIEQEEAGLRVLRAEVAYLENPERLQALSQTLLGLKPISVSKVISIEDIASQFPLRDGHARRHVAREGVAREGVAREGVAREGVEK